ncbi:ABC transporter permease [Skermanella stibiiresistens SB22]|uniref:ABC transporter permease n=1 Tax=Skermanella stibiiresistens SB22 TaxID=1385369 RepID=W9H521_9PROT|nr:efflux RND transporter permease subunit [Skermanella stibiiresistens]EWY39802.1 ABC transporter permease [Skermanella stibiiresistens SB22]
MSLNISAWSIRSPVPALVFFAVVMLLGIVSFQSLPITRFPNIDVPVVSIAVTQSGAAPSEIEAQVTKQIEDAVANITGVKHVTSTVTDGSSVTAIEFRLEVDTDRAVNDVKDAIAKIRTDLPRTIDEPIVERVDVEGQAIQSYAASAPGMTLEQLSWFVDDVVKRKLQGLKGVGRIDRIGGVEREIQVQLNPDRLMSLGITAADVNRQLRATNIDLGGGRGELGGQEQAIRTLAGARTIESLRQSRIVLPGGREVRLSDLGEVVDSYEEPRAFGKLNGQQQVVSFAVFRSKGASNVEVGRVVEEELARISAIQPDVTYTLIDDTVDYIEGNYEAAMGTLLEGAALAVVVVFIFLRDWRATLIAAIAMPLSAVPTFWVMSMMGFSLNLVSLLAITLVTGILVDDAIVEIENIVRHMRMGKSPYRAAMEAADEIGLAVIAITLTIVAVFAPVSFMGGIPGQYFKQFGLTVAVAVLFSLLVARLITPMMAAYLMRPHPPRPERDGAIMRAYTGFLRVTLRFRFLTLLVGMGLFATSIWATGLLPTGFIPAEDAARTVVSVELPPGATLQDTVATTDRIAATLRQMPEVKSVFTMGGTTPTGNREIRKAALYVMLTPKGERQLTQKQVEAQISERLADIPDIRAWYVNERGERELSITVMGNDGDALSEAVASIEAAMRRQPGFSNAAASAGLDRPEIRVTPRLDEAARFGVSPETISETVRVATIGDVDANLAKFNAGDRQIPIRVQLDTQARHDLRLIETLAVPNSAGYAVPLMSLANVTFGQGPSSIERYDRERRVLIGADLTGGLTLGDALARIKALPEVQNMPAGTRIQESGDAEIMGEVFAGFAAAMGAGLLMVLGVLILLFHNVFQPITILLSLPLSIGGVIIALLLTGNPISMPVVIGILMLMGIVTKNAIMLVDFAVEQERKGMNRIDAIIDAGRKRAQPIVMTTIAMAAGMLPSAMGAGDGGEFRAPMAIAVIGGLLVSTVLSLIFVPSFYTIMEGVSERVGGFLGRFVGPKEEDDDPHQPTAVKAPSPPYRHAAE